MTLLKKLQITLPLFAFLFLFASPAFAAAPDGLGPWADSVASFHQGLMKNGLPVPAIRSNPNAALGIAENNTIPGNFFSLGFGGHIVLGFDNGISSGVFIVEATNPGYPIEKAKVEVSENGTTWINAGQVSQDGSVNKPAGLGCARFVRLTDISNPNDFSDATADGYDVDGVKATGKACTPPTNGGGNCKNIISQKNKTDVSTTIITNSNTGKNSSNGNTGSSGSITTGDTSSNITTVVTGSSNVVNGGGCCAGGDTAVNVNKNGAGSNVTVNINSYKKVK